MLRVSQVKLKVGHTEEELRQKLLRLLQLTNEDLLNVEIRKQSLDARRKPDLFYVYTLDVSVKKEEAVLKRIHKKRHTEEITVCRETKYKFPESGLEIPSSRPVIVGCGPAGLFCCYFLAAYGYHPILIEQGAPVDERQEDIRRFWETGMLKPDSNVQFGEGGAGTFSDGKLNTLVKDPQGRIRKVLEIFVEHGAPKDILYVNKPHIGTDILISVIRSMREAILAWGGEIHFHTKMTELILNPSKNAICGIHIRRLNLPENAADAGQTLDTDTLILAPGHSSRDTFYKLYEQNIPMEAKSFAVGVRAEHPQELINISQYGSGYPECLPAAAYKLTAKLQDGRGVYSFCMCPGGYVVNASSEEGHLAVNGMSYHARDSRNANSAIIVTVTPEDFGDSHPLAGIEFQRKLERAAYKAGQGKIPVQRYGDFAKKDADESDSVFEAHVPCMKGRYSFADLKSIFPDYLNEDLVEGFEKLNTKIRGFSHPDTLISAVESRTSSPVRILRGASMESEIAGLFPCGEGAGYAGGITSAAVDGIKTAESIRRKYAPFDKSKDGLRKN